MARKTPTNPRKSASQQRSRLTVEALVEATARVLVSEGYDRASTNKIALSAGVSIGSLYQYFPSKEALVAAVIDQHIQEVIEMVRSTLDEVALAPVPVAIRELVKAMVDAHRISPKLHRVLVEQTPRVGRLENIEAIEREACVLIRNYLKNHEEELQVVDLDQAAFICVSAVEALTHALVMRNPQKVNGEPTLFINDVTRLVAGYLCRPEILSSKRAI